MKKMSLTLIAVATIAFTGCVSTPLDYKTGTQVSEEQMKNFVVGQTTKKIIINAIGQPNRKEQLRKIELWYYDFTKIGLLGSNQSESTVFEWSTDGILLKSYKTGKTGNALIDAAGK